jgi:hypothetical protein
MGNYQEAEKQDLKRRRRERYIIASLLVMVTVLTTYLGLKVFDLGPTCRSPTASSSSPSSM